MEVFKVFGKKKIVEIKFQHQLTNDKEKLKTKVYNLKNKISIKERNNYETKFKMSLDKLLPRYHKVVQWRLLTPLKK